MLEIGDEVCLKSRCLDSTGKEILIQYSKQNNHTTPRGSALDGKQEESNSIIYRVILQATLYKHYYDKSVRLGLKPFACPIYREDVGETYIPRIRVFSPKRKSNSTKSNHCRQNKSSKA